MLPSTFLTFVNEQGLGIITYVTAFLILFSYRMTEGKTRRDVRCHRIWFFSFTGEETEPQTGASGSRGKKKIFPYIFYINLNGY